jgi:hypothetical protein
MTQKTTFDESRRALLALLRRSSDPDVLMTGTDELSEIERLFLQASSAARIVEFTICMQAQFDPDVARQGLKALYSEMEQHIGDICRSSPMLRGMG